MIWMECELYEYGGADNMGNRTSRPLSRFIRGAMRVARPPGLAAGYALRDAWLACAGLHPNKKEPKRCQEPKTVFFYQCARNQFLTPYPHRTHSDTNGTRKSVSRLRNLG